MFPEAYSTVSDGYKGQSFIDDALAKSQPKLSGYLDMDNTSSSLLFDGECDDYVLFVKMGTNFLFGYCVKAGESILLILSTGLYSM